MRGVSTVSNFEFTKFTSWIYISTRRGGVMHHEYTPRSYKVNYLQTNTCKNEAQCALLPSKSAAGGAAITSAVKRQKQQLL